MSSASQQAVDTLTAQWYNAVVAGCKLDANTFQLYQSNQPLGNTSEAVWKIFDSVPPESITQYYNPSQYNNFSTDYGAVINNLKPQNARGFTSAMGDYYSQWMAYVKTSPAIPSGGILELFKNWSDLNMPPGQAQQAYTAYQQVSQGVVPVATSMWINAGGGTGGTKAYNATINDLQGMISSAPSVAFTMDSNTERSDTKHSWASGKVEGAYDLFWGSASAEWDSLTVKVANAGLEIDVKFEHLVSFSSGPLAKESSDPILSQFQPWYSSAALNLAYQNNNNVVWNNNPPTWAGTFGPAGNVQRICSALIVVDGITITTKSSVSLSDTEQKSFKTAAEGGFWPFFKASGSGGWSSDYQFDDSGSLAVTSNSKTGNPNILGAIVTTIQDLL